MLCTYVSPSNLLLHVPHSAHVYLRLRKDQLLEDVSEATIMECAQLVKANSIEGCKLKDVHVVYTRWRNLQKTAGMEAGQVGYHDKSKVRRMRVEKDQAIVNKLNRTKVERFPDLAALQEGNTNTTPIPWRPILSTLSSFAIHYMYNISYTFPLSPSCYVLPLMLLLSTCCSLA